MLKNFGWVWDFMRGIRILECMEGDVGLCEQVLIQHDCDDAAGDCEMQVGEAGLGEALQGHIHGHYEPQGVPSSVAQHCLPCGP